MDRKRYSIRFPENLAVQLEKTSKKRGLSINALVTELCWKFVEDFERKYRKIDKSSNKRNKGGTT